MKATAGLDVPRRLPCPCPRASTSPATLPGADLDVDIHLKDVDILLVEDESNAREIMRKLLQEHGAKVRAVESAAEAREAIEMRRPRLIISDIGLPGEDGYAFMRGVRTQDPNRQISALAVTAFARPEDRQQALSAGFDDHLPKPVDPDKLLELVARLAH